MVVPAHYGSSTNTDIIFGPMGDFLRDLGGIFGVIYSKNYKNPQLRSQLSPKEIGQNKKCFIQ